MNRYELEKSSIAIVPIVGGFIVILPENRNTNLGAFDDYPLQGLGEEEAPIEKAVKKELELKPIESIHYCASIADIGPLLCRLYPVESTSGTDIDKTKKAK